MPETTSSPTHPAGRLPLAACFALVAVAWTTNLVLRETYPPGHPLRLAVTAMFAASVALLAWTQVRAIRSKDEFIRTIHATALAIAFPASVVTALALGLALAEGLLTRTDPHDLPALMLAIWAASLALARRRYR
jgi:hypothetical protein